MRSFLTIVFTLQCLFSLTSIGQAHSYASLAKVSHTPANLAFVAIFLLFILAFCMMFGGVSQAESGENTREPKPDNAHGGWWNLGRFDVLLITTLLLGVCIYGIMFSELSYYMMPDSFLRPRITLNELPELILTSTAIWTGAFAVVFVLSLLVRLCHRGKPGSRSAATTTAVVAALGMLFIAASVRAAGNSGQMLSSPGSLYVCICTVCCYKAVRCVSLRCLLPEWAGGWHEGGCTPAPADVPAVPTAPSEPAATLPDDALSAAPTEPDDALPVEPTEPAAPQAAPVLQTPSRPVPPVLQVAPQASRPQRTAPQLSPAAQAPATPDNMGSKGGTLGYVILALLAVGSGIVMAEWSDKELRGISSGEGCVFGILFGLSVVPFGLFVADAFKKAFREYRAERAEKAVPYAVLIVLALGLWYALFYGLAKLMG